MKLVLDTNIFISSLLKDGVARKIVTEFSGSLLFPEYVLEEIEEHKQELIEKSGLNEIGFDILVLKLLRYVRIVPKTYYAFTEEEARKIVEHIDLGDVPILAVLYYSENAQSGAMTRN